MGKFIKKISAFIAIFLCIVILSALADSFLIGDQFLGNYQASLLDKVERLQTVESPKIILIGNSNVCFGFQSSLLEEAFHMPVVDMGLNGGLGNAFHENMIKLGLSEGDIVIVCHSSFSDKDTAISDPELAFITLEHHKELWSLVRYQDVFKLLEVYPKYLLSATENWLRGGIGNTMSTDTCYSRNAFNAYGDICVRPNSSYTFSEDSTPVPEIDEDCVERLNALNQYVKEHNATLLVAGYPIGDGEYTPDAKQFEAFETELRSKLDCDVISHYTDYFFPYEFFYDTRLHLTEEGAKIRTELLISDLQNWMSSQDSANDR